MKKTYITPKAEVVTLGTHNILADSLDIDDTPQNNIHGDAKLMDLDDWEYE